MDESRLLLEEFQRRQAVTEDQVRAGGEQGPDADDLEIDRLRARFDFVAHLHRQRAFSERTFGPGTRTKGLLDHLRKELGEVEKNPTDLTEWIDVVLLALDGAWRHGHSPEAIAAALAAKQAKNEARAWPDWRTAPADKAIEHDRSKDGAA